MTMAVYAAMPRSQPLPLVNSASLLPSSRTIARCPSPWQDLPLLLQVGRHSLSCRVLALTLHVAYVAACQLSPANITVPATEVALNLPPSWDGPTDVHLNLGETILYVMTGAIIGVGSLGIICTM
jgi:hypothetical protein